MYLFLVCFSQTNIYEKARKYTTIFFILQIIRPIKTLFYFSGVRFSIINFDLRSSLLTLGIINKFLLLSLNRSLQLSIILRTFETKSLKYFRSGIKIKAFLFCIPLTYSYFCILNTIKR